jgi:hypothetical protein
MGEPWQTNVQTKARTIERDLMPAVKLILSFSGHFLWQFQLAEIRAREGSPGYAPRKTKRGMSIKPIPLPKLQTTAFQITPSRQNG